MPHTSIKWQLVKWFLITLDVKVEVFQRLSLAHYLDKELALVLDTSSSPSSPLFINLDDIMVFSVSESQSASSSLNTHLSTRFIMESSHSGSLLPWDEEELEVRAALQVVLSRRYLMSREWLDKSTEFIFDIAPSLPDDRFRQFFRVSRESFNMILQIIQDYPVFTVKQALVHLQLAVALC